MPFIRNTSTKPGLLPRQEIFAPLHQANPTLSTELPGWVLRHEYGNLQQYYRSFAALIQNQTGNIFAQKETG